MKTEELKVLLQCGDMNINNYEFDDTILAKTVEFVKKAHVGQFDKMGYPYYTHPYRVCQLVKERFGNSPMYSEKQINFACILALLHDVCEDTKYTADDIAVELQLNNRQTEELKYALRFITHDKNTTPYSLYIKNIAEAPIIFPVWVKFCDLLDNSSLDRIIVSNDSIFLTGEDMNRINKYLISIRVLRNRLNCKNEKFICSQKEIETIDLFRTPAERKRMEKLEKLS